MVISGRTEAQVRFCMYTYIWMAGAHTHTRIPLPCSWKIKKCNAVHIFCWTFLKKLISFKSPGTNQCETIWSYYNCTSLHFLHTQSAHNILTWKPFGNVTLVSVPHTHTQQRNLSSVIHWSMWTDETQLHERNTRLTSQHCPTLLSLMGFSMDTTSAKCNYY